LLRLFVPTLRRVGFFDNLDNASHATEWQQFSALASGLGMDALLAKAPTVVDIDAGFETLVANRAEALHWNENSTQRGRLQVRSDL